MAEPTEVTQLLRDATAGGQQAAEELLPLLYDRLRRMAQARVSALPPGQTLQATALVHEVWLNLVGDEDPGWDCQAHFLGAAARAMRRIVVDQARRKQRIKRGGDRQRADQDLDGIPAAGAPVEDVLAMNEALIALEERDPRKAQVVTLRCYGGLTMPEIAKVVGTSLTTVEREWNFARAWIQSQVEGR
jgi:RNA polymerase sigma factor (TIGR02999 family)